MEISSGKHITKNRIKKETFSQNLKKYWQLYIMVIPGVLFFVLFKYVPLFGSVIAFQDYGIFTGILDSPWVGLKHFKALLEYEKFYQVFTNTVIIGLNKILFTFPVPILLALLINEIRNVYYKRTVQTIFYIPHFFSWVIISGLAFDLLSSTGLVNDIRGFFGFEPILYMQKEQYFRVIVVLTHIWRNAGWGTIVILAAITGIDPSIYESAMIDGAGKFRQIVNITLPLLMPTIIIIFLLQIGRFLDVAFEHIYNLLTPMTYSVGDIIATYNFRVGVLEGQYSITTAIGIFQSLIGFVMVVSFNKLARRVSDGGGLW